MSQTGYMIKSGGGGGGGAVPTEWVQITIDSQPVEMGKGYWANTGDSAYNVTLPTTAVAFEDRIWFQTGWTSQHDIYIHCNAGQIIRQGETEASNFLAITQGTTSPVYVELLCIEDDTVFILTTPALGVDFNSLMIFIS